MSRQSTFSKLAIAATVVFAASATGFAQGESTKSQTESSVEIVAINNAPKGYERASKSASKVSTSKKETGFSAAKFMEDARQSLTEQPLNFTKPTNSEIKFDATELNTQEFNKPAKSKSIEFVPSRGQKYPF